MTASVVGAMLGLAAGCGFLLALAGTTHPRGRSVRVGWTRRRLAAANMTQVTPARLWGVSALAAGAGGLLALLITALPVVAGLGAAVAGIAPTLLVGRRARWRRASLRGAWPEAVDMMVSGVRAGMSLPEAVTALAATGPAPLRPVFSEVASEYRASGSFAVALDVLQMRAADPVADRVVAALRLAREFGGAQLGTLLRNLSGMLREDGRIRAEIAGRQSWTIAAARMAVAAPWVTLAMLCTRPETVTAYTTTAGGVLLAVAAVLSAIAYWAMVRIGRLPTDERAVG